MIDLNFTAIFQSFKEDDEAQVEAIIQEQGIVDTIGAAAVYSAHGRKLSSQISRCILQAVVDECFLTELVYTANAFLNEDEAPGQLDPLFLKQLKEAYDQATQQILDEAPTLSDKTRVNPDLLEKIAMGSPEFLAKLLYHLCTNDDATWIILGNSFRLTVIERLQRALRDEPRTFWLIVRDACLHDACSLLTRQLQAFIQARQAAYGQIKDLEDSGFEITELSPGVIGVAIPDQQPSASDAAKQATDDWLNRSSAKRWRRNHGRR